jgi:hypothetical protein
MVRDGSSTKRPVGGTPGASCEVPVSMMLSKYLKVGFAIEKACFHRVAADLLCL